MAVAAHVAGIFITQTNVAYVANDEVDGINSINYGPSRDILDATDFKDASGAKKKLAGLKDGTISLSGDMEGADAPQNLIRSNYDAGTSIWAHVVYNPSGGANQKGYKVECLVESFSIDLAPDGKAEWSASLTFNDAPVAI